MKNRVLIAAIVFAIAGAAHAQVVKKSMRGVNKYPLDPGGTFVLDNAIGDIIIVGAEIPEIEAEFVTTITAANEAAFQQAQLQSGLVEGGDSKTRVVRSAVAANYRQSPWSVSVRWNVRVPKSASLRITSYSSNQIRVSNVFGNVNIKNFNGNIFLLNLNASTFTESVNGSIVYSTPRPRGNVVLTTVNGSVTATVAGNADLRWVAKTVTGDIRTNLPARGTFFGTTFRGSINAPGGPTINTSSLMGNVYLLAAGSAAGTTQSIRNVPNVVTQPAVAGIQQTSAGPRGDYIRPTVQSMKYSTTLGDVKVDRIRADAEIFTGAGQVQLGQVGGSCKVQSLGGPLQLGEIMGVLTASTRAGDILVDSTRRGGTISTDGGTITLLYTSGPTRLKSLGGDITVRQAASSVNAETTSGDIVITLDPESKTETIDAKTGKGNVIINVPTGFRADVDATILTNDPTGDTILSDLPGLSITREQVGGTMRVRAVGKINGGGEKLVLQSTGGDIRISTGRVGPTLVKRR
ncbi:MAG TPA: DUF4097 family beta strand repeat-containing protein [Thermoanaerobaculia bacterium]|jgi:DUF4097 and DUF4098 domain-containing protein YvlB|nr:DUF4097 family beta strand repeat-containing protein [Thermoanaerobaculia bacterium]